MVNFPAIKQDIISAVESLPKVPCPVTHFFAPGVYVREMLIPAGTIAIGHCHKTEHLCTLLSGVAVFYKEDEPPVKIMGPTTFLSGKGHKVVYALTDIKVQNCHPNPDNIRDQDVLENQYIEKTGRFEPEQVEDHGKPETEIIIDDAVDLPQGFETAINIRSSQIHGKGVFASWPFAPGEYIAPYEIEGKPTIIAKYINHSDHSNCAILPVIAGEKILIAETPILGDLGDSKGQELTINYEAIT